MIVAIASSWNFGDWLRRSSISLAVIGWPICVPCGMWPEASSGAFFLANESSGERWQSWVHAGVGRHICEGQFSRLAVADLKGHLAEHHLSEPAFALAAVKLKLDVLDLLAQQRSRDRRGDPAGGIDQAVLF